MSRVQILRGDARALPLADNTVDLVCTSPPYFALRSYTDNGVHFASQIGSEATPAEWLAALLEVTAECVRVLKPSGSLFVNLGDKYAHAGGQQLKPSPAQESGGWGTGGKAVNAARVAKTWGFPSKSLMGLPWRYALACIDQLGLILRAEIVWAKPNGLPESVTDRVRRSHETWFHFVLQPRYYSAVDEIREDYTADPKPRGQAPNGASPLTGGIPTIHPREPLGKLPGSVWTIPSEPLTVPPELGVDHFAAFPLEWPRRIIRGWAPTGVCMQCGFLVGSSYDNGMHGVRKANNGRAHQEHARESTRTTEQQVLHEDMLKSLERTASGQYEGLAADNEGLHRPPCTEPSDGRPNRLRDGASADRGRSDRPHAGTRRSGSSPERGEGRQPLGELRTAREGQPRSNVGCDAAIQDRLPILRPRDTSARVCPNCASPEIGQSLILDPFGGTGTVALAAHALGRDAIHVDLSADYNRIARWRTTDRDQLAKAMQVTRDEKARDNDLYDVDPLFEVGA